MRGFACSALYNLQLPECKVDAAGRVFRVRGSSFLEKTCLGSPKKRGLPEKRLFNAIKKKDARATCNRSGSMCKVHITQLNVIYCKNTDALFIQRPNPTLLDGTGGASRAACTRSGCLNKASYSVPIDQVRARLSSKPNRVTHRSQHCCQT